MSRSNKVLGFIGLIALISVGLRYSVSLSLNTSDAAVNIRTPGSCTGGWQLCSYVSTSDNFYSSGLNVTGDWYNFGYNFATTSSSTTPIPDITGVRVGVEGRVDKRGSKCPAGQLSVRISRDGGVSYGPAHLVSLPCGNADAMTWVNVSTDFPWVATDLNGSKPRVQLTCSSNTKCYIDWLPLEVTTNP